MRRLFNPMTMALALMVAGGVSVAAQDARVRVQVRDQQRIVIPKELAEELRQVIDTAIGRDLGRDIGREIGRSMRDLSVGLEALRGLHYASDQSSSFKAEQTDKQTKTLALGASGELTLKNVVGDITVKTGGARDVTVEIVRISRGKTDADAKTGLERVVAEVTVRGQRGSVETKYPNDVRPAYAVSVAYNVTAPAGTQVDIDTVTGDVRVAGLQGELNAKAVSGTIELTGCARVAAAHTIAGDLTLTDVRNDGGMDVGSVSAAVHLTRVKAQRLEAGVVSGSITAHDIQTEGASFSSLSGNIEFSGSVTPKGRYEFHAHSGDVKLALTGGFDLDSRSFSGQVTVDPALSLTSTVNARTSQRRRSLRGTAGDGGATVVANTFSGNVWVGRKLN